jgi:hypothetical protein
MHDVADHVVESLETWARWALDRRGGRAHALSAEGRYIAERLRGDEEEDRRDVRVPLDVRRALATFERINPVAGFPVVLYLALTAEFVLRLREHEVRGYLRRHGHEVARRDVDALVRRAVAEAARRLA